MSPRTRKRKRPLDLSAAPAPRERAKDAAKNLSTGEAGEQERYFGEVGEVTGKAQDTPVASPRPRNAAKGRKKGGVPQRLPLSVLVARGAVLYPPSPDWLADRGGDEGGVRIGVIGAAVAGLQGSWSAQGLVALNALYREEFAVLDRMVCPVCERGLNGASLLPHLYQAHRWTSEAIATWLDSQEL